jgi:hypothetical protein
LKIIIIIINHIMALMHRRITKDQRERAKHQQQLIGLIVSQWVLSAAEVYHHRYLLKRPYHDSSYRGEDWLQDLLNGHSNRFHSQFGVHKHVFRRLVTEFRTMGMTNSKYLALEEHIAIFLYSVVTGLSIRLIAERFQHSFETVSTSVSIFSIRYHAANNSSVTSRKSFAYYHLHPSTSNTYAYPGLVPLPHPKFPPIRNFIPFSKMSLVRLMAHTFPATLPPKSVKHPATAREVSPRTAWQHVHLISASNMCSVDGKGQLLI